MFRIRKYGNSSTALIVTMALVVMATTKAAEKVLKSSADHVVRVDHVTLFKDFWDWRLRESPELATSLGIGDYDDRLESFTVEALKHRKLHSESLLVIANGIDARFLSLEDATSLALLRQDLRTYVDGYDWIRYGTYNPMNIVEGIYKDYTYWLSSMRFDSEKSYANYVIRLRGLVTQVHEQMNLMRESLRGGTAYHRISVEPLPAFLDAMDYRVIHSPFYQPFNESLEYIDISANKMEKLRAEGASVIQDHVFPVYRTLSRFLKQEYLPNARQNEGVSSLPGGGGYYRACLRWYLASDISPQMLHRLGKDSVEAILMKIEALRIKSGYSGRLDEFIKHANRANKFFYRTEDELLEVYEDMVHNRIPERLPKLFYRSTLKPPLIQKMPFDGPAAVLMPGNEDDSFQTVFFVNTQEPLKRPKWEILATALHETLPGKYMQFSYALNQSFPSFRKWREYRKLHSIPFQFLHNTAYSEGWALYAESLGYDLELFSGLYEQFGQLHSELYRACEMVIDTGIHELSWSRSEAVDMLMGHVGVSRAKAEADVDRIITLPGQAVAPPYGRLQITLLRKMSQSKLGERFNIREFHHQVLRLGPVPMNVLQKAIHRWLDTVSPSAGQASFPGTEPVTTVITGTVLCYLIANSFVTPSYLDCF